MTPTKLSKSVLKKIQQEKIKPHARWEFLVQSLLVLIATIIFLVIGILGTAIIFLFLSDLQLLEIFTFGSWHLFKILFLGLPLFWVTTSTLLGFLTSFLMQGQVKKGYKLSLWWWLGGIIALQLFGGFLLEQSPLGNDIDEHMSRRIWFQENVVERRERVWSRPEEGFLGGKIQKIRESELLIQDRKKNEWTVDITEAETHPRAKMEKGYPIRMLGEGTGENTFKALRILPWEPPNHRRGRRGGVPDGPPPFPYSERRR